MAGKTSLLKQLKGLKFNINESQTHGINIETIKLSEFKKLEKKGLSNIHANFWDFGGQEIMHSSHQFFLSQRSLYILVVDSRSDDKKEYWLNHISKFGGNPPTIVVINKIDENPQYDVERNSLNKKYPFIKNRFHKISCVTGKNIKNLKETICEALLDTKLFGTPISSNWLKVRDLLVYETTINKYINKTKFTNLCNQSSVTDPIEQKTLLTFLNDIGVILHFNDINLDDIFVLDPHWVTVGVYRIINSEMPNNGILAYEKLDFVLNNEQIKKTEYDPNKNKSFYYGSLERNYIIQIMKEFELCYELNKFEIILPNLLPKEPDFRITPPNNDVLRFNFTYDFLHPSVISRLIIQMKNDIPDGKLWRYGMKLKNENTEAFVFADLSGSSISVFVYGNKFNRRYYFSILRHRIKEINNSFINLQIKELIPLPGYKNKFVSYIELLNHEKSNKLEYYNGELNKAFKVKSLLDGVVDNEQRKEDYKIMEKENDEKGIHIHFENIGNPKTTIDLKSESSSKSKAKSKVINAISNDVQNFLGETEMLKEDIERELRIKKVPEEDIQLAKSDVEVAEKAIQEIEQAQQENQEPKPASKNRLTRFINDLGDENSTINKTLKMLRKGKDYGVQLAEIYNKIAQNTGMPSVPPLVLEVIKKI